MPGNPAYAGMSVTVSDTSGPTTIILNGSSKVFWGPAGAVTVATLAGQGLTVTNPAFVATKALIEGSPAVFAGAPVALGTKTGTLPPATPPQDKITLV